MLLGPRGRLRVFVAACFLFAFILSEEAWNFATRVKTIVCARTPAVRDIDKTRHRPRQCPYLYSLQLGVATESHRCISMTHAQWRALKRAPCDAGCKNLRMEIHLLSIRRACAHASPAMRCVRRPLRTMQNASVVHQRASKAAMDVSARARHTPDAVARSNSSSPTPSPRR